ncbi:lipopolysaccharide transport periplasmic protein LptA [Pelagibacterium montanilacus]|uniref:lipopolysaccharide transport periplasmic protein LptA n=1 Tax=Pelagibacterium montanilacus TaxID=2185280 RepID=UPI000F8C4F9F|nr:lipopolysaccharide transport periplasmic protein LptA [Pelagibacterium montanilacus]
MQPLIPLLIALVLAGPSVAMAQQSGAVDASALASDSGEPVDISADSLEIAEDSNRAVFSGNVVIVQGAMEMRAPRAEAVYGEGGPSDLVEFTASGGRVMMVTEDQEVEADTARYDFRDRTLVFTGNVTVINASGQIDSDRLVIDTRAGTSSFTGGGESGGRVRSVLTPGGS